MRYVTPRLLPGTQAHTILILRKYRRLQESDIPRLDIYCYVNILSNELLLYRTWRLTFVVSLSIFISIDKLDIFPWNWYLQGVPKKMWFKPIFEFMTFEGVFSGVKNNSKNFGNKKILDCLAKFWVNGPCFVQNLPFFLSFYKFVSLENVKIIWKVKIFDIYMCICKNIDFYDILKKFSILDMARSS